MVWGDIDTLDAPIEITAAIEAMPDDVRVIFLRAIEGISSPAHLSVIAHHLLNGDGLSAAFVAQVHSDTYKRMDVDILAAYAIGAAS